MPIRSSRFLCKHTTLNNVSTFVVKKLCTSVKLTVLGAAAGYVFRRFWQSNCGKRRSVSTCTSVCLSALKKTRLPPDIFFFVEVSIDDYYLNLCTYRPIWLESDFKVLDTLLEDQSAFVKTTLHLRLHYSTRNPLPGTKEWFVLCKMFFF